MEDGEGISSVCDGACEELSDSGESEDCSCSEDEYCSLCLVTSSGEDTSTDEEEVEKFVVEV